MIVLPKVYLQLHLLQSYFCFGFFSYMQGNGEVLRWREVWSSLTSAPPTDLLLPRADVVVSISMFLQASGSSGRSKGFPLRQPVKGIAVLPPAWLTYIWVWLQFYLVAVLKAFLFCIFCLFDLLKWMLATLPCPAKVAGSMQILGVLDGFITSLPAPV